MARWVVLLRGVNVGGKNRLPMADFVARLEEEGATDVATYIQSGNAVASMRAAEAKTLPGRLTAAIERAHGLKVPVVVRSAAAMNKLAGANPFLADGAADKALHVGFLAQKPRPAAVAALDPDRSPGDAFAVVGSDVFLHLPSGVAGTKLGTAWFDRALSTTMTVRNWRTVTKLVALASG